MKLAAVARTSTIILLFFAGLFFAIPATAAATKKSKGIGPSAAIALQYADAISQGDIVKTTKLDFTCQYRLVAATRSGLTSSPDKSDASYESCWQGIKAAHAPALERVDVGMDVLWPTNGALPFFRDDLTHYPASAFVMDLIGLSPPGSGLRLEAVSTTPLPNASFHLRPQAPLISVPATLVTLTVDLSGSPDGSHHEGPGQLQVDEHRQAGSAGRQET